MSTTTTAVEIDGLKTRLKETWMAGDYDRFSRYMEQGARIFYEQLDIPAGCQLLDVGCGSGQVALWAAREGVNVTGVDIEPNLIQRAQARAKAEGLSARFMEGDAEALPHYNFTYPFPPGEVVEFFRQYYRPTNRAFVSLDETSARQLREELEALWSAHNRAGATLTVVQAEYLEVI